ncbi:helix-turn-helix domain-containing protein [Paenibacillus sp. P25]|nr:helix-turn-helix domain-containing protein [Paenibacillus sp. P25]
MLPGYRRHHLQRLCQSGPGRARQSALRQTGKTIGWIASQSGYPNEKYFCRVFREVTGMLPSEYRKRSKLQAAD